MNTIMHCKCGAHLPLEVLRSGSKYFLGYYCTMCGPYARVGDDFEALEAAEGVLDATNAAFEAQQPTPSGYKSPPTW